MKTPAWFYCVVFSSICVFEARAQDLLGVAWGGQVVLVDSRTAAVTPLGTGVFGQNALARDGRGRFWTTRRTGSTPYVYDFATLDPSTGAATIVYPGTFDVRGWTGTGGNALWAIQRSTASILVRIDLATGVSTTIGATSYSGIQGLALHRGVLYGWDITSGLVVIDPATGAGRDPFPALGGPSGLQFLCSHSDGRLLAGGGSSTNSLYEVDVATGISTLIGVMSGANDLRGLEQFNGASVSYGQGCSGAFGTVSSTVGGVLRASGQIIATSNNHAPGAPGILVIGISDASYLGLPLPFALDPLLGTTGCSLLASLEAQLAGAAGPVGPANLQFALPIPSHVGDFTIYLQHACFEPVPGNMSWSDGAAVYIAY